MVSADAKPHESTLPPDSLVTVTGANGYVASHIIDNLLASGFRVRGTVRDCAKSSWLTSYCDEKYGPGRFELVSVKDITADDAFDEAVKDAGAVVHTVAVNSFDLKPDVVISTNVNSTLNVARAAARSASVSRLIYTSSSSSAAFFKPGEHYEVNKDTYNEEAIAVVQSGQLPEGFAGGFAIYSASKTKAEQALWEWYRQEKPGFVLNSIVPAAVLGHVLQPKFQGFPSILGYLRPVWNGQLSPEAQHGFGAQWYNDVVDIARLHMAALLFSDVKDERIIAYAHPFNLNDLLQSFRRIQPEREFPPEIPDLGIDKGKVDNTRATELLQRLGRSGWASLDECLTPLVKQYAESE